MHGQFEWLPHLWNRSFIGGQRPTRRSWLSVFAQSRLFPTKPLGMGVPMSRKPSVSTPRCAHSLSEVNGSVCWGSWPHCSPRLPLARCKSGWHCPAWQRIGGGKVSFCVSRHLFCRCCKDQHILFEVNFWRTSPPPQACVQLSDPYPAFCHRRLLIVI